MKNIHIIFLFSLLTFSCQQQTAPVEDAKTKQQQDQLQLTSEQMQQIDVQTGRLEQREISEDLKFVGLIDVPPQNMISVSLPLGGYLKSTHLLPGMHVMKNEVIATVEDQQFIQLQQDYLSAKARLYMLDKEYQRQKELNKNKASSDKNFQLAESEYTTQKIALRSIGEKLRLIHLDPETLSEQNLSRTVKVYSPISGFVKRVNVNIGKYVMPSDVLFELVNPEDIHLNLKVFDKDLSKLKIGQKVIAFNNTQPDLKYPCEIILISQDLKADRSAEVHCHFERYDHSLLPGMYMNAVVSIKSGLAACITNEAIVNFDNKPYVFVEVSNGQYQLKSIQVGTTDATHTEVLNFDSFGSNAKIVTKGSYSMLMQLKKSEDN